MAPVTRASSGACCRPGPRQSSFGLASSLSTIPQSYQGTGAWVSLLIARQLDTPIKSCTVICLTENILLQYVCKQQYARYCSFPGVVKLVSRVGHLPYKMEYNLDGTVPTAVMNFVADRRWPYCFDIRLLNHIPYEIFPIQNSKGFQVGKSISEGPSKAGSLESSKPPFTIRIQNS